MKAMLLLLILLLSAGILLAGTTNTGQQRDPFYLEGAKFKQNFLVDTPNEYISLYTGDLAINQTDFFFPGQAGLDLALQRNYSSRLWSLNIDFFGGGSRSASGMAEMSCLGFGWTMHLGKIENAYGSGIETDLPVVVMPDGSRHPLYKDKNNATQFISKELWRLKDIAPDPQVAGKWELTLTNGTKYIFEYNTGLPAGHRNFIPGLIGWMEGPQHIAQTTQITDTHNNTITINYTIIDPFQIFLKMPRINTITDSCGREINFQYYTGSDGATRGLLKSLNFGQQTYQYSYLNKGQYLDILTSVTPSEGNSWQYQYYDDPAIFFGVTGNDLLLKKVTYPTGAEVTYEYEEQRLTAGKIQEADNSYSFYADFFKVLKKKTVAGREVPSAEYNYTYNSSYATTNSTDYDLLYDCTTVTYPAGEKETYYFYGWGATQPVRTVDLNHTEHQYSNTLWKLGHLVRKDIKKDTTRVYREENEYTKNYTATGPNPLTSESEYFLQGLIEQKAGVFFSLLTRKTITQGTDYITTYTSYDSYGNPLKINESGNGKTRAANLQYWNDTTKNILGKMTSQQITVDTETFSSSYAYDSNGEITSANENGITALYQYFSGGNLKMETDGNNHSIVYDNYAYSRPGLIKYGADSAGNTPLYTVTQSINPSGTVSSVTNGRIYTMTYSYDHLNRLTQITPPTVPPATLPLEAVTNIIYANDGSNKEVKKGTAWTKYYFDGLGRHTGTENAIGIKTKIDYDPSGNILFNSYPYTTDQTKGERYTYDPLNRITKIIKPYPETNPANAVVTYAYNDSAHTVGITNENGIKTEYTYQSFGNPNKKRLGKTVQAVGKTEQATTTYIYNALGSVTAIQLPPFIQLPAGVSRTYTYNTSNLLVSETTPEKWTTTYTYYPAGNVKTKTDVSNTTVTYSYDSLDRIIQVDYSAGNDYDITYSYDQADNKIGESNSYSSTSYAYNALNKLTSKQETIKGKQYITSYTYNNQGMIATMTYPSGRLLSYTYDHGNRITSLSPFAQDITYHPSGKIQSFIGGNQKTISLAYDDLSRLKSISGSTALNYGYDQRSNITSLEQGTQKRAFSYDAHDRLTADTEVTNPEVPQALLAYTYDPLGNRTKKVSGAYIGTTYSYNTCNQLGLQDSRIYYHYDAVGNLIGSDKIYAFERRSIYPIDRYALGPNDKITDSSSKKEYTYAPNQRKISEQNPAGSTVYHYNEAGNLIAETGVDGACKRDYVYLGGTLLARAQPEGLDLALYRQDILFPRYLSSVNKPVKIQAKIHNYGSVQNTATVNVNFYEVTPSTAVASNSLTLIGSQVVAGAGTAEITWTPVARGVHEIYAWVDPPTSVITEIDKTNNIASNFFFTDPSYIRINPKDQEAFKTFMQGCPRREVACEK